MISLAKFYEQALEVKTVEKKTFPPEVDDGKAASVKKKNTKGESQDIIVKPDYDESVIIRRKKK